MRKRIVKNVAVLTVIFAIVLGVFYFFWLYPKYTVPVLMYHRFGYDKSTLFISPGNFERQMQYLKNRKYNVISLDELVEGIKSGRAFAHNSVVITVDDGYQDNYTYAYPVLKKYGFPATIFLISNFIGRNSGFMSWDEVREMSKHDISFGGHTRNHVYLPSVKEENILQDETKGCKEFIEHKLGSTVDYFCYPTGGFTERVKEIVKKSGYKGACTTNRGFAEFNRDVYELKRIKVTNSDINKPLSFWIKLSGYYNLFRSRKGGY